MKETQYGELREVVVHPNYQKEGISSKLVNKLLEFFKSRDVITVEVLIDSKNSVGIKVWSALGFKEELKVMKKII